MISFWSFLFPLPQALISAVKAIISHQKLSQQRQFFMASISLSIPIYFFISCQLQDVTVGEAVANMENLNMPYFLYSTYTCIFLLLFTPSNELVYKIDEDPEQKVKDVEIQEHSAKNNAYNVNICTVDRILSFLLFLSFVQLEGVAYIQQNFGSVEKEQLIFHMKLKAFDSYASQYIVLLVVKCVIVPFILKLIITYALQNAPNYFEFDWEIKFSVKFHKKIFQILFFVYCFYLLYTQVSLVQVLIPEKGSSFIEDHYVKPTKDILTYPNKSRNFIFLCLESFETSFSSKKFGGGFDDNYIPLMTKQALKNTHFGTKNTIGGNIYTAHASWSIAAHFAMWSGLPLKWCARNKNNGFAPGAITVLDILAERKYDQTYICGYRDGYEVGSLYRTHGNLDFIDYNRILKDFPKYKNYRGGWGLSDEAVYNVAKDIINQKAKAGSPYTVVINTIETHFPDGIRCKLCKKETDWKYFDVIKCADRQANNFLEYLKKIPKYNETTIVVVGDHTTMSSEMGKRLKGQQRKIYHTIINPYIEKPYKPKVERKFSTFDWFPTILAALGFKIKGEKLGLGVNLFSNEKTLYEEMGWNMMGEISKPSRFYNEKIMFSEDIDLRVAIKGNWY